MYSSLETIVPAWLVSMVRGEESPVVVAEVGCLWGELSSEWAIREGWAPLASSVANITVPVCIWDKQQT